MPKVFSAKVLAEAEKIHKPMLDQYFEDGMGVSLLGLSRKRSG